MCALCTEHYGFNGSHPDSLCEGSRCEEAMEIYLDFKEEET